MAVLTFSRQSGSLGTQIAIRLAERLAYPLLDREAIEESMAAHGMTGASIEKFDERRPDFWDTFGSEKTRYLHFLKGVICAFALEGRGVILGRAAQVVLAGVPGIRHIRVIAPLDLRLAHILEETEGDARRAEQILRHHDQDRAGFHKYFFNVDWDDPGLYDLVLNTRNFSLEATLDLLETTARHAEDYGQGDERAHRLGDLCLKHQVETHILYEEQIRVSFLDAEASDGVVTLTGTVTDRPDVVRCKHAAAQVPGVKGVHNRIQYSQKRWYRI
jgi:cytidylate kinase